LEEEGEIRGREVTGEELVSSFTVGSSSSSAKTINNAIEEE
jgi:hypothetical protein